MELDMTRWSGDGSFTQALIERLRGEPGVAGVRVEDAPASREDAGYSFISNEVFVSPVVEWRPNVARRWWTWTGNRRVAVPAIALTDLERWLSADAAIGAPDFADEGMLQYLRTERIIPAYQTRGYKLVELIRVYMAGTEPRR